MKDLKFEWTGFRGFRKNTSLRVPKLTILIGKNNVGKSSAYAPLLLMKQTLDANEPTTALLGRGKLIDMGNYSDYVSNHNIHDEVTFRIDIPFEGQGGAVSSAKTGESSATSPYSLETTFKSENGSIPFLSKQRILSEVGKSIITRSRNYSDSIFNLNSPILPTREKSGRPYREITQLRKSLREEQPMGFLFSASAGLRLPYRARNDPKRWAELRDWYAATLELYDLQTEVNRRTRGFLDGISYLGPLRSLPQRTYRLSAEKPSEAGNQGELAPEILFRQKDEETADEVNLWLEKLGYGKLEFNEIGGDYFQVNLKTVTGLAVNIADTGVGLSQIIPLLVQGVSAKKGSLIISQQPEIHLNPAQQSILADFLIDKAKTGTRMLIETHSEHILLRLRRRIAEEKISADEVAVYFVENVDSETLIKEVPIGELGDISRDDWPSGFFEDRLGEAFSLAAAQSERRKSGK